METLRSRKDVCQAIVAKVRRLLDTNTMPWHRPWRVPLGPGPYGLIPWSGVWAARLPEFTHFQATAAPDSGTQRGRGGIRGRGRKTWDLVEECEQIINGMPHPPTIHVGGIYPLYKPSTDTVWIPIKPFFNSAAEYYHALFHELVHSTGHRSRLNRKGIVDTGLGLGPAFGSASYAEEELIAETGVMLLVAQTSISNAVLDLSTAYIDDWREGTTGNMLKTVKTQARKAANFILGNYTHR